MSRSRFVVAAIVVGCSSGTSQAPPTQPPTPSEQESSTETPLSFASCPKAEDAPANDRSLRSPPVRRPAPGLFGTDGLEPRQTPQAGKTCQAARTTLDTANDKILGAPKPGEATGVPRAWDRRTDPARWSRVAQRYGLDQRHRAALARDGFVVAKGATHWGYVEAYHEIFQSQLPIYVSIDSVMHAIYASHEGVIGDVEGKVLLPRLRDLLSKMHCEMATVAASWPYDVARDVDLYLTVARTLLTMDRYSALSKRKPSVTSLLGNDGSVDLLVGKIMAAKGFEEIELFGRKRMIDFGAFQPRGRYASNESYFRAMSWLSRIEMNLVSRSSRSSTMRPDPSETPRETAVALALVDLARATETLDTIADIDHVWGELAGKREDVSFTELDRLRGQANLDRVSLAAQPALARVIGTGYKRSIPTQPHPDGLTDLPVITAMFGARVTPDTAAIAPIIQPAVPQRISVGAADVGFLLGHDRAKHHLAKELAEHPKLDTQLVVARSELDARLAGDDLYSLWLRAIRALAKPTAGTLPTFMKSDGFADLRMSSAIAAFGQIRSSYELMGGMAYLGSGCEIPDGYVEPAAETYDALIAYADRGKALLAKIDPQDVSEAQTYFTRLGTTLRVLRAIVATELAGQPLTLAQKEWLSMVVEIVMRDGSGAPPTYAGWYFDLYRNFEDATKDPDFITGFAQNLDTTMYLGATDPRIGVFVIDTGGAPRVVVGPIAAAYETTAPTSEGRLTLDHDYDETRPKPNRHEPWAQSYVVEDGAKPKITTQENWDDRNWFLDVGAMTNVGAITIRLLDHHRVPMAAQTKIIGPGRTRFRFPRSKADKAEMVQLQYGNFSQWSARQTGGESSFSFWVTTKAEYEAIEKFLEPKQQP